MAADQITELLREPAPNDLDGQRDEVSRALVELTSAVQTLRGDVSQHLPESIPAGQFLNYENSAPVQAWWAGFSGLGDALTRLAGEECKIEPAS